MFTGIVLECFNDLGLGLAFNDPLASSAEAPRSRRRLTRGLTSFLASAAPDPALLPPFISMMKRRKLTLKAKNESSFMITQFQALRSGRFQRGLDRVNLHRPTMSHARVLSSTFSSFTYSLTLDQGRRADNAATVIYAAASTLDTRG